MTGGTLAFLLFAVLIPLVVNEAGDLAPSLARCLQRKNVELDRAPHRRYLRHVAMPLSTAFAGIVMRETAAARLLTWSLR